MRQNHRPRHSPPNSRSPILPAHSHRHCLHQRLNLGHQPHPFLPHTPISTLMPTTRPSSPNNPPNHPLQPWPLEHNTTSTTPPQTPPPTPKKTPSNPPSTQRSSTSPTASPKTPHKSFATNLTARRSSIPALTASLRASASCLARRRHRLLLRRACRGVRAVVRSGCLSCSWYLG